MFKRGRVYDALKSNETLTEAEKSELENMTYGMDVDKNLFGDNIAEEALKIKGIIEFLQQSDRISEDEEEELHMIVNDIEARR